MQKRHWWAFKFQSDSINTYSEAAKQVATKKFKFQSDSINTEAGKKAVENVVIPLNSNLILLIQNQCLRKNTGI